MEYDKIYELSLEEFKKLNIKNEDEIDNWRRSCKKKQFSDSIMSRKFKIKLYYKSMQIYNNLNGRFELIHI